MLGMRVLTFLLIAGAIALDAKAQRVFPFGSGTTGTVYDLEVFQNELVIGGLFGAMNGHVRKHLVAWNGSGYNDMGASFSTTADRAYALQLLGSDLIVGGVEAAFGNIGRWDGSEWHSMAEGFPAAVRSMVLFNGEVVAGGDQGLIKKWDGLQWFVLLDNSTGSIRALEVHQGILYAGTDFPPYLMAWDGSTWQAVTDGLNAAVNDMILYNGDLLIGGSFTATGSGTTELMHLAKFDGTDLTHEGLPGVTTSVTSMCVGPDDQGVIIAGGNNAVHLTTGRPMTWVPPGARTIASYNGRQFIGGFFFAERELAIRGFAELVPGSDIEYLDVSNIKVYCTPTPRLNSDPFSQNAAGFEAPIGSGRHAIYSAVP